MENNILYKIFGLIITSIALYSCTEPYYPELSSTYTRLIVYAEISTDTMPQSVSLSKSADYFDNKQTEGVTGALVKISDGEITTVLTENGNKPGIYETPDDFYGIPGKTYTLEIENVDIDNNGTAENYSASSYLPYLNPLDSAKLKYSSLFPGSEVMLYAWDPAETEDFYMFRLKKNGILLTDSLQKLNPQNDIFLNGNYTNGITVMFLSDKRPNERIEGNDYITFEIYGINKNYFNFIMEAKTEYYGSNPFFSGPPANIYSNISNGALGIFTTVNIKRTWFYAPPRE